MEATLGPPLGHGRDQHPERRPPRIPEGRPPGAILDRRPEHGPVVRRVGDAERDVGLADHGDRLATGRPGQGRLQGRAEADEPLQGHRVEQRRRAAEKAMFCGVYRPNSIA